MQRSLVFSRGLRVHFGASLQQKPHHVVMIHGRCHVERRPAEPVGHVHVPSYKNDKHMNRDPGGLGVGVVGRWEGDWRGRGAGTGRETGRGRVRGRGRGTGCP